MIRRIRLGILGVALVVPILTSTAGEPVFDFVELCARARKMAAQEYRSPQGEVPGWLKNLSYDQLRRIEFDGRTSLWGKEGLPFAVQYLHPGFLLDRTVRVNELEGTRARVVPFRRDYFNYRGVEAGPMPESMGFAGFRVMYPFRGHGQPPDEVGSFAGASYFRFLCAGAAYGLSARGLALDTGEPTAEEFPRFTEFWLERPAKGARALVILALLDSPSVAGAYRFTITPGASTGVEVKAVVYFRKQAKVVGVAPLTSMFWRGENSNSATDDFRPEVHDSDGLSMQTGGGEWLWRPLVNHRHLRVATFADENPRGFGLLQRDRSFESYQDLEAMYHARPSTWVETLGKWGKGGVRLVEIPTSTEFDDNIVAMWVPASSPRPGESLEFEYRLHWFLEGRGPPAGVVRATRTGKTAYYEPGLHRFVVDFDGPGLQALGAGTELTPIVTGGDGARLNHTSIQKNRINGSWRVAFTIRPDGAGLPVELRCFVRGASGALTETWSYLWQP
jgi:glucans biosynthesis protein